MDFKSSGGDHRRLWRHVGRWCRRRRAELDGLAGCGYNTINPVELIEAAPVVIETYDWVIV